MKARDALVVAVCICLVFIAILFIEYRVAKLERKLRAVQIQGESSVPLQDIEISGNFVMKIDGYSVKADTDEGSGELAGLFRYQWKEVIRHVSQYDERGLPDAW